MKAFVTGAASPLGRALTAALIRRGHRVVGHVRRRSGVTLMQNLGAEPLIGDLTAPDGLVKGMQGCDAVFHVAGFFDFWAKEKQIFDAVNVDGTKSTIAAAILAKVPRLVYVSSSATIGEFPGQLGNEWTRHRGYTHTQFERSKLAAERTALKLRARGIQIVVVNPGIVVAPADTGWCGRLISDCVAGRRWFAAEAPMGWVWASDAAEGIIRAYEKGKDGERYILSGTTLSPRQFLTQVARLAGKMPPFSLPRRIAMVRAFLSTAIGAAFGRRPALTLDEARFTSIGLKTDGSFAQSELGLAYTPLSKYLPSVVDSYKQALARFS